MMTAIENTMRRYNGTLHICAATRADHDAVMDVLGSPQVEVDSPPFMLGYGVDTFDDTRALVDRLRDAGLHDGRLALSVMDHTTRTSR